MNIRSATPDDIPAMMALERQAVTAAKWSQRQYEELFATPGPTTSRQNSGRHASRELTPTRREGSGLGGTRTSASPSIWDGPRRLVLVIEDEAGVQGFLAARGVGAEWEIENIVIAEPLRRRGLGSRLLGQFLEQARGEGARSVFLEVRESNQAARTLYEKWAFVPGGRRPRYYHNPEEDAVVYRLSFV